jgi:hypothetical protein
MQFTSWESGWTFRAGHDVEMKRKNNVPSENNPACEFETSSLNLSQLLNGDVLCFL